MSLYQWNILEQDVNNIHQNKDCIQWGSVADYKNSLGWTDGFLDGVCISGIGVKNLWNQEIEFLSETAVIETSGEQFRKNLNLKFLTVI